MKNKNCRVEKSNDPLNDIGSEVKQAFCKIFYFVLNFLIGSESKRF